MGGFDGNRTERQNMEFAKAVPTNGYGEVEATVIASLGHPGAPQPRPAATAKLKKKVCRIYSPVSIDRGTAGLRGRRRQQHDACRRPHTVDSTAIGRSRPVGIAAIGTAEVAQEDADPARLVEVPRHSRPVTSDSVSRRQHQHRRNGQPAGRVTACRSRLYSDTAGIAATDQQRGPSTSSDLRRKGPAGPRSDSDRRAAHHALGSDRSLPKYEKGEQQLEVLPQRGQGPPPEEERKLRHHISSDLRGSNRPMTADSSDRSPQPQAPARSTEEPETPPNRYWPTPGGAKGFLRPFIERNQKRLWAYDPAFVGMDHMEAYRHVVSKGDFEAVKRTLLEKEDALTRGTGSFLMADVIEQFRGNSGRRPATSTPSMGDGPHRKGDTFQRFRRRSFPSTPTASMMESDPFLSGDCNSDKLRKEEERRRGLLKHAAARSNIFCRRKGYEPGDFLKHRSSTGAAGKMIRTSARPSSRAEKLTVEGVTHERARLL